MITGIAVGALAALVALALGVDWRRGRRLRAAAAARGWSYRFREQELTRRWESWPFGVGRLRRARHVVRGSIAGREMLAFEYSYRQPVPGGPSGPAEATSTWSVAAVRLPSALPRVVVTRHGLPDRTTARLGRQDVQLDSEDFSRRFRVRTDDPRTAVAVLNPGTVAYLLEAPFFEFRLESADALSCWPGRLRLDDVDQRLPFLIRVVRGVPDYVWGDRSR